MDAKQILQHTLLLANATAIDALVEKFRLAIQMFGCKYFILTGLPFGRQRFENLVLKRFWPEEWMSHYLSSDYIKQDPVVRTCVTSKIPFTWKEAAVQTSLYSPAADRIMMEAADAGLRDGCCVPIVVRNAPTGCISLAAEAPIARTDALSSLNMLSLAFASRLQLLAEHACRKGRPRLSEREREVLSWVAEGKTTWAISCIMTISESTVNKHITNAMRKLDCVTRAQVVVKALIVGEIAA
ncbi:LuxR family transcriptional regulator [Chelativorans alearense]|uniref:LuxR family transcriptional regulator n=1 Tax=Chelativorans alearense TaxID=2681495 RepID=UPI0013D6BBF1|nr:LuxR family transcriptional regulator [Chelativorans alearense]